MSTTSREDGGAVSATAATAITLSRLITRSATRMVRIAAARFFAGSIDASLSLPFSNWTPIHSNSAEPISLT